MAGLNASAVAIAMDVDDVMTCRARAGATAPEIGTPVQRERGITGECVRTGAMVRCDDTLNDPRVDAAVCEQLHIGSILVAPLLRNAEPVGIVEAFFVLPNSFDDVDVEFLQHVAQQIVALIWGEEAATTPAATANRPEEPPFNGTGEPPSLTAQADEAAALVGPPAEEPLSTVPTERPPNLADYSSSLPAPVSHRRTIAIAFGVLVAIVIGTVIDAHWRKPPAARTTPPAAMPSSQPAPQDPLAGLRHAAEAGDPAAQYQLARAYKTGSKVNADPQQANAWLRTAADHGSPDAQLDWARAHETSDPVEAYTWYVIAGQNGKSAADGPIRRLTPKLTPAQIAQVRLDVGRKYLSGHALRHDPVAAYVWFRLAEWGGNTTARSEMQRVESQLTAGQIRKADARASEWIRRHTVPAARNESAAADVQR